MLNINHKNKKSIIIFITISVITVFIVTSVYLLAQNKITENKENHQKSILNKILSSDSIKYNNNILKSIIYIKNNQYLKSQDYLPVYIATFNNKITAIIIETIAPDGYNGKINVLVALKPNFQNIKSSKIINIKITNHEETPGLGDKFDENKYHLMNPQNNKKWTVKKDYNDAIIDSWTGATITPRAITKAAYNVLLFFEKNYKTIIDTKYKEKIIIQNF